MFASSSAPIVVFHIQMKLVTLMSWVKGPIRGTKFSQLLADKAKAKRLESVKVTKTKEDLVTVRNNVATQVGTAHDLYCKLLANDTDAHHFLKLVI